VNIGRIKNNKKFHTRKPTREKYLKKNQIEAAITAIMIILLTIAG
jgi:hypothetical protein